MLQSKPLQDSFECKRVIPQATMVSEYVQDSDDSSHIAAGLFLRTLSLLTLEAYVVSLCVWVLQLTRLQQPLQSPLLFGHEMGTRKLGVSTLFIMKLLMLRSWLGTSKPAPSLLCCLVAAMSASSWRQAACWLC